MLRYLSNVQRHLGSGRQRPNLKPDLICRDCPPSRRLILRRRQPKRVLQRRAWQLLILLQLSLGIGWGAARLLNSRPQFAPTKAKSFTALGSSPPITLEQAQTLFATPNSVGVIAIGMAEGTRTIEGDKTPAWQGHSDSGNGAINQGTFSWQGNARSAEDADQQAIDHIQNTVIPSLLEDGVQHQVRLSPSLLLQGVDLWIQSPAAGNKFVVNLKRCRNSNELETDILLCARMQSYYDSQTGELDATGFNNDSTRLMQDQLRRIHNVEQVIAWNSEMIPSGWIEARH